ncbi:MAG TPA: hypothetical protein VM759_00695, partial [Longimicrobium sp.]|nr:hypothetical protein [Longimicrobium sp.]
EGAIVGEQVEAGAWPDLPWVERLRTAIAERLTPGSEELAPPLYGGLQGDFGGSIEGGDAPAWLRALNLDPRYRATASLGTRLVQRHQEALMASAWEQSAEIREANRLLRQAQMAAAVGEVLAERVRRADPGRLLQMTHRAHGQVSAGGEAAAQARQALRAGADGDGKDGVAGLRALRRDEEPTVAEAVRTNVAVESAVSGAFRRVARPTGPLARRLAPAETALEAPVERLGLPVEQAEAVRPAPVLEMPAGTVDLATVADGAESLAALTAARVATPVFPWEQGAPVPGAPPRIAVGYLADLVVVTRDRYSGRTAAGMARGLDFDGVAQQGWQALPQWAWPLATAESQVDLPSFPNVQGRVGRLSFGVHVDRYPVGDAFYARTWWTPGPTLEPVTDQRRVAADLFSGSTTSPRLRDVTVAGNDFTGTGSVDPVVGYVDASGFPYFAVRSTRGWQTVLLGPTTANAPSVAAAGSQVFVMDVRYSHDRRLRIHTLTDGRLGTPSFVDVRPMLPNDTTSAALAAADFGGGTGADLLVFFVAGEGRTRRAGYRIAYDVRPGGSVGRWGEVRGAPIPVAGDDIMLLLGASTAARAQARATVASAFRAAAVQTQLRQERLTPRAAPPPPPPALDTAQLAADVASGLDPAGAVKAGVAERLQLAEPVPETVADPLQPLAITPRFPYPTFELFRDEFQDRLFPGASRIPDDCVTALRVNRATVESFLVGLNHEMSRELLWRGFPVRHGTFFREFWDARREEIAPIEGWDLDSPLGAHGPGGDGEGSLLLVVRAELIRRIPDAILYAVPAKAGDGGGRTPDFSRRRDPLFGGRLNPDIRFFGFDLSAADARGDDGLGWYFVFQQHPTAPRFGVNEGEGSEGAGTVPATWADLTWPQIAATEDEYESLAYADAGRGAWLSERPSLGDGGGSSMTHRWGFSAAHMAHIVLQRPVQVAIHGSDLVAADAPAGVAEEVAS